MVLTQNYTVMFIYRAGTCCTSIMCLLDYTHINNVIKTVNGFENFKIIYIFNWN